MSVNVSDASKAAVEVVTLANVLGHMSTIGDQSDGGADSGYLFFNRFQANKAATLTDIFLYCTNTSGGAGRVAIYTDSSSKPHTLLAQSSSQTLVNGWNDFSGFSQDLVNGTYYWLAWQTSDNSALFYTFNVGSTNFVYASQSYGSFPSTAPSCTTSTGEYCIYGLYEYIATSTSDSSNAASDALGTYGPKPADASNAASDFVYSFAPSYLDASNAAVDTVSISGGGNVSAGDASAAAVDSITLTATFGVSDSSNAAVDAFVSTILISVPGDASNAATEQFGNLSGTYSIPAGIPCVFADSFAEGFASAYLWNLSNNASYNTGLLPILVTSPAMGGYSPYVAEITAQYLSPQGSQFQGQNFYNVNPWTLLSTWTGQQTKEVWTQCWAYVPAIISTSEAGVSTLTTQADLILLGVIFDFATGCLEVSYMLSGSSASFDACLCPLNQWFQITTHAKIATTSSSNDGVCQVWIGAKCVLNLTGINNYYEGDNQTPMYIWSWESYCANELTPSNMLFYWAYPAMYAPGTSVVIADFSQPGADLGYQGLMEFAFDVSNVTVDSITSQLASLPLSDVSNLSVDSQLTSAVVFSTDASSVSSDSPLLSVLALMNDASNAGADSGSVNANLPSSDHSNVSVDMVSARLIGLLDLSNQAADLSVITLSVADLSNAGVDAATLQALLSLLESSASYDAAQKQSLAKLISVLEQSAGADSILVNAVLAIFGAGAGADSVKAGQLYSRSVILKGDGAMVVLRGDGAPVVVQ